MDIECYAYEYMSLWGEFGLVRVQMLLGESKDLILCFTMRALGERRRWRKGSLVSCKT